MVKILKQMLSLFSKKDRSQKVNKKFCECEHPCKKPETTIRERATYARQLKLNPLFDVMVNELKNDAIEEWENAPARDVDGREMLWTYVKVLEQVKKKIEGYIAEGIVEEDKEKHRAEAQ